MFEENAFNPWQDGLELELELELEQMWIWKSRQSTDVEKLPKVLRSFLDEELKSYFIDYRQNWYRDKSPNYCTHLIVWLKTLHLFFVEIICKQSIANIKNHFQPLHKPRLTRRQRF